MKSTLFLISSLLLLPTISKAGDFCSFCPERGNNNFLEAHLVSMDTATGSITIDFELYLTAIDTIMDSIQVIINRDCAEDRIYADAFISYACAIGCEDLFTGKPCAWIDRCNYWGHQYSQWRAVYQTWGKGSLSVWYGRTLILYVEFNFLDPGGYGEPNFVGISFKNKDFSTITPGDVFDAYESIGIVADVGWELRVAPAIQIKLIAGMAEMMVEAPLYQSNGHEGIYRVLLPAWALSSLVGSGYNSPGFRETITAEPLPFACDFNGEVPKDNITVVNYSLHVEKVSFHDDYQIYKDSPSAPPINVPITDPVWIRGTSKNDSVAYKRGSNYKMEIEISSSYTPYHDFQYQIRGVAGTFTTGNYDGHMSGANHNTITDIIPASYGSFADSVGVIDSLRFFWVATKIGFGFDTGEIITISGPHTIFLTYDKPLLDTVNVLALDKICHYAQDEYIDTMVAKDGVNGVYGEGWAYDPNHHIFDEPLDVVRKETGQCADYANLLVYLYEAVGIQSNAVVIFNAAQSGNLYYLTWWNLETNNRYANIYSNLLTSCDGTTKYWDFTYHVVAACPEHYCDAALGLFRKTSDYSSWWRYYVYPQARLPNPDDYLDAEPPPVEPYYYNRLIYALPPIFPTGLLEYDTYHRHRHP